MRGEPPPDSPTRHSAGLHGAVAADLDAQLAGAHTGLKKHLQIL